MSAVAADWSGARTGEQRALWLAEWDPDRTAVVAVSGRTRVQAGDRILDLAADAPELVAGLDFSFSLPAWWLARNGIATAAELWADSTRLERWLAECRPPFWGRPGRSRPRPPAGDEWRLTERAAPLRPASTFQIGGAGAVGTASLRGMATLDRLRRAGMCVWPFERWATPAVVEVWPRLGMGRTVKSSPAARAAAVEAMGERLAPDVAAAARGSVDAFDAVVALLDLVRRTDQARPATTDPVVALEGWIDGVALDGGALSPWRR